MMNMEENIIQRFRQVSQLPPLPALLPLTAVESYSSHFPNQEEGPCHIFPETDQLLQATPFTSPPALEWRGGEGATGGRLA